MDFNEDTLVVTINGEQGVELNYKELSLSHFQIFNMLDCTISNRSSTWWDIFFFLFDIINFQLWVCYFHSYGVIDEDGLEITFGNGKTFNVILGDWSLITYLLTHCPLIQDHWSTEKWVGKWCIDFCIIWAYVRTIIFVSFHEM